MSCMPNLCKTKYEYTPPTSLIQSALVTTREYELKHQLKHEEFLQYPGSNSQLNNEEAPPLSAVLQSSTTDQDQSVSRKRTICVKGREDAVKGCQKGRLLRALSPGNSAILPAKVSMEKDSIPIMIRCAHPLIPRSPPKNPPTRIINTDQVPAEERSGPLSTSDDMHPNIQTVNEELLVSTKQLAEHIAGENVKHHIPISTSIKRTSISISQVTRGSLQVVHKNPHAHPYSPGRLNSPLPVGEEGTKNAVNISRIATGSCKIVSQKVQSKDVLNELFVPAIEGPDLFKSNYHRSRSIRPSSNVTLVLPKPKHTPKASLKDSAYLDRKSTRLNSSH